MVTDYQLETQDFQPLWTTGSPGSPFDQSFSEALGINRDRLRAIAAGDEPEDPEDGELSIYQQYWEAVVRGELDVNWGEVIGLIRRINEIPEQHLVDTTELLLLDYTQMQGDYRSLLTRAGLADETLIDEFMSEWTDFLDSLGFDSWVLNDPDEVSAALVDHSRQLAENMSDFAGEILAWTQQRNPSLRPLASGQTAAQTNTYRTRHELIVLANDLANPGRQAVEAEHVTQLLNTARDLGAADIRQGLQNVDADFVYWSLQLGQEQVDNPNGPIMNRHTPTAKRIRAGARRNNQHIRWQANYSRQDTRCLRFAWQRHSSNC